MTMIHSTDWRSQYAGLQGFAEIWPILDQNVGQMIALHDPHGKPEVRLTYSQLWQQIQQFAIGLQNLGIEATTDGLPPRIALFPDG